MPILSTASPDKAERDDFVQRLLTKYVEKGLGFSHKDYEAFVSHLQAKKGYSTDVVDELREVFTEELSKVKHHAQNFASKVMNKYGGKSNITDSMLLDFLERQFDKRDYSPAMRSAVIHEVQWILNDRFPQRSNFFRFTPAGATRISKRLGYVGHDFTGTLVTKDKDDEQYVKEIREIYRKSEKDQWDVIQQSLGYQNSTYLTNVEYDIRDKQSWAIPPVVAALFLPKMKAVDEMLLFSNIAGLVVSRADGDAIHLRPDWELFYNLITDKNERVCDRKNPIKDLLKRASIQTALWNNVNALRSGKFYDESTESLLEALDECKYYKYDAMDLQYSGDDADALRRIMMAFSWRPVRIQTLPTFQPDHTQVLGLMNPYTNLQAFNGEIDTLPMVNIRLNLLNADKWANEPPVPDAAAAKYEVSKLLNEQELFFDDSADLIVPKMVRIIGTNSILAVHIHRKRYAVPVMKFDGPVTFREMPLLAGEYFDLDETPVTPEPVLKITKTQPAAGSDDLVLKSIIVTRVTPYKPLVSHTGAVVQDKKVINGSFTVIPTDLSSSSTAFGNLRVYDPLITYRAAASLTKEKPLRDVGTDAAIIKEINEHSSVLIYAKNDA